MTNAAADQVPRHSKSVGMLNQAIWSDTVIASAKYGYPKGNLRGSILTDMTIVRTARIV